MSWPWRALLGPGLWALAFSTLYALHGLGCARGWPARPTPLGPLHETALIVGWLLALALAALILWRSPRGGGTEAQLIRAGGWIGLGGVALTLFPVLGVSTCTA